MGENGNGSGKETAGGEWLLFSTPAEGLKNT